MCDSAILEGYIRFFVLFLNFGKCFFIDSIVLFLRSNFIFLFVRFLEGSRDGWGGGWEGVERKFFVIVIF